MQRACDVCGRAYQAKRSTSKYCGSGCRGRAAQGAGKAPEPVAVGAVAGRVVETTRSVLEDAGRVDTPLGAAALVLAGRLDGGRNETGPGLASLARQLEATLAAATAGVTVERSPLEQRRDELAARRAARGA